MWTYLSTAYIPLAIIAIALAYTAVATIDRFGARALWSVWLMFGLAALFLYVQVTRRMLSNERFGIVGLMDDAFWLPPLLVAAATHVLQRLRVRRSGRIPLGAIAAFLGMFFVSYLAVF